MGWNDHIEFIETECMACGETDTWQYWNKVALARYGGPLGVKLGLDASKDGRCPYCGSTDGKQVDPDAWLDY